MNKEETERYARQMILPQIGIDGQEKLKRAKILIIGVGGLGSPVALYLAAAGIGTIGIVDGDVLDQSNLQRQILYDTSCLGKKKVYLAKERLQAINPYIEILAFNNYITPENISDIIESYDFVIDGTDKIEMKFLINDACVIKKIPFCHAGVSRFAGQVMTWVPGKGACYRCIFEDLPKENKPDPVQNGIIGAIPGIIGSIQALEAIKYITGAGELLTGRMYILDGLTMQGRIVRFPKPSKQCKVCGGHPNICNIKANRELYQIED